MGRCKAQRAIERILETSLPFSLQMFLLPHTLSPLLLEHHQDSCKTFSLTNISFILFFCIFHFSYAVFCSFSVPPGIVLQINSGISTSCFVSRNRKFPQHKSINRGSLSTVRYSIMFFRCCKIPKIRTIESCFKQKSDKIRCTV